VKPTTILTLSLITPIVILAVLIRSATVGLKSDTDTLNEMIRETAVAPNIKYPTKDIRGVIIPSFDYLVVMPDCTSCSTFRTSMVPYMKAHPKATFLVLTPDLTNIAPLMENKRCFVFQYTQKSIFSDIIPGVYNR